MKKGIIIICIFCVIFCTVAPIGLTANAETKEIINVGERKDKINKGALKGIKGKEVWNYFETDKFSFGIYLYIESQDPEIDSYTEYVNIDIDNQGMTINGNNISWSIINEMGENIVQNIIGNAYGYIIYIDTKSNKVPTKNGYDYICQALIVEEYLEGTDPKVLYHFYNVNNVKYNTEIDPNDYTEEEKTIFANGEQDVTTAGILKWVRIQDPEFGSQIDNISTLDRVTIYSPPAPARFNIITGAKKLPENENKIIINPRGENELLKKLFKEYPFIVYENQAIKNYNQGITYEKNTIDEESASYRQGYIVGVENANKYTFNNLITSAIDVPVKMIIGLLDFEILGTNILSLMGALLGISIVIFIAGKILKL